MKKQEKQEEEENNEKDVSTQKTRKKKRARISKKNEHPRWEKHSQKPKEKRTKKADSLGIKTEWLKSRRDFELVFSRGKKTISSDFALHFLPVNRIGIRTGICVGKSLCGAVKRNRTKRQIREILRKIEFNIDNVNIVLVARRRIITRDFHYMREKIYEILKKARLI